MKLQKSLRHIGRFVLNGMCVLLSGSRVIDIQSNIHVLINIYNAQRRVRAACSYWWFIKNNEAASIIGRGPRFDG